MGSQERDFASAAPQVMADFEEGLGGQRGKDVYEVPSVPVFLEFVGPLARVEEALVTYLGSWIDEWEANRLAPGVPSLSDRILMTSGFKVHSTDVSLKQERVSAQQLAAPKTCSTDSYRSCH